MFRWFRRKKPLPPPPPERWHFPLSDFLALLRANGFAIGVDTHIRVQALLQRLHLPADIDLLPHYLTPLLAQNQEQQAFLHQQLGRWFYREQLVINTEENTKEKPSLSEKEPEPSRPDHLKSPDESVDSTAAPTEGERLVLHLSRASQRSKGLSFAVPQVSVEYPLPVLRQLRQLRFMTETSRRRFDLKATLAEMARKGSVDSPKWRYHRRHVEYLLIVEQNIHRDHRAAMVKELYQTLNHNNVDALLYTYHSDPRTLMPYQGKSETSLRQLAATHSQAILLYFGSNTLWMEPETLQHYRWTKVFSQWEQRYWFPITPPDQWGVWEEAGTQIFPQMLPLSMEGLQQLSHHLAEGDNDEVIRFDFWTDHLDYNLTDINTQLPLQDIALYFSPIMKQWIAACAVYPELNWDLTLAIGQLLSTPSLNLCQAEAISQLLRLDWFQKGYIPPPMRYALMEKWLDTGTLTWVHTYIAKLMRNDIRYETLSEFPAYRMQLALHELMAETNPEKQETLVEQLKDDIEAGHQPTDMVSLHYLNQQELSPLFFVIPEDIVSHLEGMLGSPAKQIKHQESLPQKKKKKTSPTAANMIPITGGTFEMGDVLNDNEYDDEKPVHKVTVNDFYLAKYAITFEEYDAFCDATEREKPSDREWGRGKHPAINVNWYDAVEYCNWLSRQEGFTPVYTITKQMEVALEEGSREDVQWDVQTDQNANGYRLPTEAEWEYAAREGGKKVRFGNGKDIADPKEINFDASENNKTDYSVVGEYRKRTVPVGSLNSPNSLGLHDMSGNVWEWCEDDWHSNYEGAPQDGSAWIDSPRGSERVPRGGSWSYDPQICRAAYRGSRLPPYRYYIIGFRVARSF